MGIFNRDYMRRPSDDNGGSSSSPDTEVEAFLGDFLKRHPRFFVCVGLGFVVLIIIALLAVKFSS
jgi:hypothetical protein